MKTVDKVEIMENNPSLFMIRGLLHYALGDLDSALKDLEQCLNESTKPIPIVFYLIGLIFSETGNYEDAIKEFTRVIDNDSRHIIPEAYLNRAKCKILIDEKMNAFRDIHSFTNLRPASPEWHIWTGHFLFCFG